MLTKEKILQDIYDLKEKSPQETADYMFDEYPIIKRHFSLIDEVIYDINLTEVNEQMLYLLIFFHAPYINQLDNYRFLYQKVVDEAEARGYSEKRIELLFEKWKDGGNHLYDPDAVPHKTHEEMYLITLNKKIELAQQMNDKNLENLLENYKHNLNFYEMQRQQYLQMRYTLGEEELKKRTVIALRALADKLEEDGPHFITHVTLPKVPIFSEEYDFCEGGAINLHIAPYPMGG